MSAAIRNAASSDPVQDTKALISDSRIAPESRRLHRAAPHPFPPKALWRFMPVEKNVGACSRIPRTMRRPLSWKGSHQHFASREL